MQFTLRDAIEEKYGTEAADTLFYQAGFKAGCEFYRNMLGEMIDFESFIRKLQEVMREMGMGILRIEQADLEAGVITLTLAEDLDCSGMPELDYEICVYDEGFLSGLLESYTGKPFAVREIDCWCTGDRTCRFRAETIK
jgi:predicted hydrocarbon binding protein